MEIVHNPHDKMFKQVFKIRENAVSLLRNILPPEIQKDLDLEALYFENDSYVSQDFADYYSDLLTSVPVAGSEQETKIYFLFEHKSTNYPDTPLQLLRYMLEIWDRHGKMTRNPDGKLPVVIPVVVTHPRSLWKDKRIADFVSLPSEAFRAYIPDFDYLLYDSTREDPEHYEFNEPVRALLTLWKYSHRPEFMEALAKVFRLIRQIDPEVKLRDFLSLVMQYLYAVRGEDEYIDIENVARNEIPNAEEYMGTIAEMLERRGEEKGVVIGEQRGKLENAQEMLIKSLKMRFDFVKPHIIDKIKSIQSRDVLENLFELSFKCSTIEDFTKYLDEA